MAKLYFRYGTVGSAKTLNLLAVAHNYERQGKGVVVMKPSVDTRFGASRVASRAGLEREADLLLENQTELPPELFDSCHCVLVDEAQFVSAFVIDQLRELTAARDIPVICYGLRNDFRTHLFAGSRRLLELADSIEEIKTTCACCNRKAVFNLKSVDGKPTLAGPSRTLGCEELYLPACHTHYVEKLGLSAGQVRENVTTNGIDFASLAVGQRIALGGQIVLQISKPCAPCSRMDEIRPGLQQELEGRRGMLASVVEGGAVKVGDLVRVL